MTVERKLNKQVIALDLDGGTFDGKQKIKTKKFLVKLDATDLNMYTVGVTLSGLQDHALLDVRNEQNVSLVEL